MTNERTLLTKANELLQGWVAWAEHRHLTQEQFDRLVHETDETIDALVTALADEPPAAHYHTNCPTCRCKDPEGGSLRGHAVYADEVPPLKSTEPTHEHRWVLPQPPMDATATNYFCGDCGFFPGPAVKSSRDPALWPDKCPTCGGPRNEQGLTHTMQCPEMWAR